MTRRGTALFGATMLAWRVALQTLVERLTGGGSE
jgi:hypothetical protein